MKLFWTIEARRNLYDIGKFIGQNNPEASVLFVKKIRDQISTLIDTPQTGRVVPEFDRIDIREILYKKYRIVYKVETNEIFVLTVFEGHQLLKDQLCLSD